MGRAIPRLLADANKNFSVPLSGTSILAKFNSGNLSCIAQNSLVTFNGRSTRSARDEMLDKSKEQANFARNIEEFPVLPIITLVPTTTTTVTVAPTLGQKSTTSETSSASPQSTQATMPPTTPAESSLASIFSSSSSRMSRPPASTTSRAPASLFPLTEEVRDFARVAILYILQEQSVEKASSSQTILQQLFSSDITEQEASNVDLGNGNNINLASRSVNIGSGPVGSKNV
ncbi:uncharacterized protein MAM_03310 [Metarhizium album ARSEF 1941]|uniref:Uncharacterized protein n=1 Tax=Metarhizium album (strain ARSEF 1941) TaxID=1081103 RepID=A0A0B2WXT9_METAS|nr:uncharacterized protein MAM_03310 [Metarhizium album ARSEF 1941]KHN98848.1 hypothetical protein MAM_03310 [Metarhizium album ARSEF 1941]